MVRTCPSAYQSEFCEDFHVFIVNISSTEDGWTNSLQFLIHDLSMNSYSWTPTFGNKISGSIKSLNAQSVNSVNLIIKFVNHLFLIMFYH